jgi:hypothetical protein
MYTCDPSYNGDGDWEDVGSRPFIHVFVVATHLPFQLCKREVTVQAIPPEEHN